MADAVDVHPAKLVTVYMYVPEDRPDIVVLVPVPAIAPGLITQFPEGKLFNITLPVATSQVGCVMLPTVKIAGVSGCVLITTFAVGKEIQPSVFVTVKEYVPATRPDNIISVVDPEIDPGLRDQIPGGKPLN